MKEPRVLMPERCVPPSRVSVALGVWQRLLMIETGIVDSNGQPVVEGRVLDPQELGLRQASLDTLRNFISGESNCDPVPPVNLNALEEEQPSTCLGSSEVIVMSEDQYANFLKTLTPPTGGETAC